MGSQARITSVDAIESFRASLIVYLTRARGSVDEVGDDVRRMKLWLQHDRRVHWEGEIRRRKRTLDQAEQDLMSARLNKLNETVTTRQALVHRARRALEEAESKLRKVKVWSRDYETEATELLRKLEGIRNVVDVQIPEAIEYLTSICSALDSYERIKAPEAAAPASPSPEEKP